MKKIWNLIKTPPMWLCIISCLLTLIAGVFSIVCLYFSLARWYAITTYSLFAVFLGFSIYSVVKLYRRIKRWFVGILSRNKYTKNIILNYGLNTCIKSVYSTFYNLVYCIFLGVSAYMSGSFWLLCLTIYHLALGLTKSVVLVGGFKSFRKKQPNPELKQSYVYRNCGIFLIVMAFAISGMLVQMILMEADIRYANLLIYVVAGHTIYKVCMTVYNMVRAKQSKHPIAQAVRNINFITALISLFSLQVALINAFSHGESMLVLNLISGTGIGIYMISLGAYMIVKGQININTYKKQASIPKTIQQKIIQPKQEPKPKPGLINKRLINKPNLIIEKPIDASSDIVEEE